MTKEYGDIQLGNSAEWRSAGQNQLSQMLWKYLKERSERPNVNGDIRKQVQRLKEENAVPDKHAFNVAIGDNLDTVPFTAFEVHKALKDKVFAKRLFEKNLQRTPTNEEIERFHRRLKDVTKIEEKELTLERLVKAQNDVFEEARTKGLVKKEEEVPGVFNEYIDYEDPHGRALLAKQQKYENDILTLEGSLKKLDPQRFLKRKETYSRDIGEIENNKKQVLDLYRSNAISTESKITALEQEGNKIDSIIRELEEKSRVLLNEKENLLNYSSAQNEKSRVLINKINQTKQEINALKSNHNSLFAQIPGLNHDIEMAQNRPSGLSDYTNKPYPQDFSPYLRKYGWNQDTYNASVKQAFVNFLKNKKQEILNQINQSDTSSLESDVDQLNQQYNHAILEESNAKQKAALIEENIQRLPKKESFQNAILANREEISSFKVQLIEELKKLKQKQDFFDNDLNTKKREYDAAEYADRFEEEKLKEKVNEYKIEKNKIWEEAQRLGLIAKNKNTKKADYIKEDTQEGKDLAKELKIYEDKIIEAKRNYNFLDKEPTESERKQQEQAELEIQSRNFWNQAKDLGLIKKVQGSDGITREHIDTSTAQGRRIFDSKFNVDEKLKHLDLLNSELPVEKRAETGAQIRELLRNYESIAPMNKLHQFSTDMALRNAHIHEDNAKKLNDAYSNANTNVLKEIAPHIKKTEKTHQEYTKDFMDDYDRSLIKTLREESEDDFLKKVAPGIQHSMIMNGAFHGGKREKFLERSAVDQKKALDREISKLLYQAKKDSMNHYEKEKEHNLGAANVLSIASKNQQDSELKKLEEQRQNNLANNISNEALRKGIQEEAILKQLQEQKEIDFRRAEIEREAEKPIQDIQKMGAFIEGQQPPVFNESFQRPINPQAPNPYNAEIMTMAGLYNQPHQRHAKGGTVKSKTLTPHSSSPTFLDSLQRGMRNIDFGEVRDFLGGITDHRRAKAQRSNENYRYNSDVEHFDRLHRDNDRKLATEARKLSTDDFDPKDSLIQNIAMHAATNMRGDPMENLGKGMAAHQEALHRSREHMMSSRERAASIYQKIAETRLHQQNLLNDYAVKKEAQEENIRANDLSREQKRRENRIHRDSLEESRRKNDQDYENHKRSLDLTSRGQDFSHQQHKDALAETMRAHNLSAKQAQDALEETRRYHNMDIGSKHLSISEKQAYHNQKLANEETANRFKAQKLTPSEAREKALLEKQKEAFEDMKQNSSELLEIAPKIKSGRVLDQVVQNPYWASFGSGDDQQNLMEKFDKAASRLAASEAQKQFGARAGVKGYEAIKKDQKPTRSLLSETNKEISKQYYDYADHAIKKIDSRLDYLYSKEQGIPLQSHQPSHDLSNVSTEELLRRLHEQ